MCLRSVHDDVHIAIISASAWDGVKIVWEDVSAGSMRDSLKQPNRLSNLNLLRLRGV